MPVKIYPSVPSKSKYKKFAKGTTSAIPSSGSYSWAITGLTFKPSLMYVQDSVQGEMGCYQTLEGVFIDCISKGGANTNANNYVYASLAIQGGFTVNFYSTGSYIGRTVSWIAYGN